MSFLGTPLITALLFTVTMSAMMRRIGQRKSVRRSWHHNLACALAAKDFAKSFGKDAEEGYNAGLFHDLGRLALITIRPVLYDQLIAEAGDLLALERKNFGIDHCEAGAWLIENWKLPSVFLDVARYHHAPKADGNDLTMLLHAACTVADRLGFSVHETDPEEIQEPQDPLGQSITRAVNELAREYGL